MNGGRGGGPMNNFPPPGRGGPQPYHGFGGRNGNYPQRQQQNSQQFHRNQTNLPPQPNNFSHGPPLRGPPPGITGRGRMENMGYNNSFNDGRGRGRGRGRSIIAGRHSFGARGCQHQRPPPPPPMRGRGVGQGNFFPPPPPPQFSPHHSRPGVQLGPNSTRNPNSPPFQTPGLPRVNQMQQPQNGYQQQQHHQQFQPPSQQHDPLTSKPAAPSSSSANNNSFENYQQITNPAHKTYGMQHQLSSVIISSNGTTNPTVTAPPTRQIEEAWKEYTAPGGVKYYYNELSKESTYDMPDALKKKMLPILKTEKLSSSLKRPWQEHEDANTGKKYYSDGVQTTWEKPEGFVSPETIVANTSFSSKRDGHKGPSKKKKRSSNNESSSTDDNDIKENTFANKKEATTAFKGFLLAKGISPTQKWNEVLKICESDSRWDSFQKGLSMGECRQALAEYQTKRTNEIRNEERRERVRAKEAFGQLLADILPSVSGFSARTSRFADVRNSVSKDNRFFAVEDESTRESLFLDFCDDFKKREERNKRNKKREAQDSFVSFLQEREEGGTLTYALTWESFLLSLSEEDKSDSRLATSQTISDADRQLYFADFVFDLQKAEDDKRRRIQDARRRAEKSHRDQYRDLIHRMASDGKIFPYTRWREIEETLAQEDSFKLVEVQDRGSPREIFEVFVDGWDETYRRERNFLSRLLRPPGQISDGATFDSFKKTLAQESAYSSEIQDETLRIVNREDPVSSARLLFNELAAHPINRGSRQGSVNEDSSEDEGEIIEDGEVVDNDDKDDGKPTKP